MQVDGTAIAHVDVVVGVAAIGAALAVLQGDFTVGVLGGDGRVDIDVVMGVQRQGGGGIPSHGGIDVDIAGFAAVGHCL